MAVVENGGISRVGSSTQLDAIGGTQTHVIAGDHLHHQHQSPKTVTLNHQSPSTLRSTKPPPPTDQSFHTNLVVEQQNQKIVSAQQNTDGQLPPQRIEGNRHRNINGVDTRRNGVDKVFVNGGGEGFQKEMRDLEEMLSKLNPMAQEFVPPSLVTTNHHWLLPPAAGHFAYTASSFLLPSNAGIPDGRRPKKSGNNQVRTDDGKHGAARRFKRRTYSRTSMAQREDVIRRTVYVSEIDHQVTEEQLAALFLHCGQVVDCRVCGDPNSVLRFAFVEFTDEEGAANALSLAGTMLGYYPVRVLPSKTAIAPVNPTFLPQSEEEREMCARTIYCTNIDKKITHSELKLFFESMCGEVYRLRMLGDNHHSTRIAFVEFVMAESAIAALNCSGAIIGSLPIRVSPSKTPVRPRPPLRAAVH